jgi:tetratricopeptide (TPR) repeat protein
MPLHRSAACMTPRTSILFAALALRAAASFAHGPVHEQIEALTSRIERTPDDASLYLARGELHRVHRDWSAALADYDAAAKRDPGLSRVDLCRGRTLLEADRPAEAKTALDLFLAREPSSAEGLVARARTLTALNDPDTAARDYTSALERIDSPGPELYIERAQALASIGESRRAEAIQGLDEGIRRLGPLVTLELPAIELDLDAKLYDSALERVERVSSQSQRKERWLVRRGEILSQAGRSLEARAAFAEAITSIEALPSRIRSTRAMADLEARARAALGSTPVADPKR